MSGGRRRCGRSLVRRIELLVAVLIGSAVVAGVVTVDFPSRARWMKGDLSRRLWNRDTLGAAERMRKLAAMLPSVIADPGRSLSQLALVPVLYDELRRMARRQRAREAGNPTFQTTELVHEAYLRLADDIRVTERGRAYFMGAASRAMRRVPIDAARRRGADKRGGGAVRVTLSDDVASVDTFAGLPLVLEALERVQRARGDSAAAAAVRERREGLSGSALGRGEPI